MLKIKNFAMQFMQSMVLKKVRLKKEYKKQSKNGQKKINPQKILNNDENN